MQQPLSPLSTIQWIWGWGWVGGGVCNFLRCSSDLVSGAFIPSVPLPWLLMLPFSSHLLKLSLHIRALERQFRRGFLWPGLLVLPHCLLPFIQRNRTPDFHEQHGSARSRPHPPASPAARQVMRWRHDQATPVKAGVAWCFPGIFLNRGLCTLSSLPPPLF